MSPNSITTYLLELYKLKLYALYIQKHYPIKTFVMHQPPKEPLDGMICKNILFYTKCATKMILYFAVDSHKS